MDKKSKEKYCIVVEPYIDERMAIIVDLNCYIYNYYYNHISSNAPSELCQRDEWQPIHGEGTFEAKFRI